MADNPQTNQAQQQNPAREATGRGEGTFSPTFLLENVKSPHFWRWVLLIFVILMVSWWTNFLRFRDILLTFGFTLLGLITVIVMIGFIIYGYYLWLSSKGENLASLYIATALFIWMLDLAPEINLPILRWLGSTYQGFEFPFYPIQKIWSIPWLPIIGSSFTFAFLYINMIYKIIKKEYIAFILSFGLIILFNYLTNQLPTYLRFNFNIPYGHIIFFALLIGFGIVAWRADKLHARTEIPEFFSFLYLMFVFSFFWLNTGWQGNLKAWFHVLFIIAFGFGYIKPKAMNVAFSYILIATLLIIDFYGYGLLYSTDVLALQFIPPLVLVVIFLCYDVETKKGTKNYTYPVAAFILLVTFILLMSVSVGGTTSAEVPFVSRKGADYKDLFTQLKEKFTGAIESRLDIATAGLYRGNVEKNRYESLGVYFGNIRAADPRFYTDEPITVWGTLRSKTYKDAVIVNFSCYRWKDNKKIRADKIIPDIIFPIFTLEEIDTQCTFLPKAESPTPAGANIVTFSAEYNFGTDAYLKTYFIDRDRFRAYAREAPEKDIETAIFKEFGIKDTKPGSVSTNGPVEIGLGAVPLVTVSEGYVIKPTIGITLTNRKEIQDKDKKIITRWEGKIKNITELILLTPPGISLQNTEKCKDPKTELEKLECPCSMPFSEYKIDDCRNSCSINVQDPCVEACKQSFAKQNEMQSCADECLTAKERCVDECNFLFRVNEGEGPIGEKYNAYSLNVGSKQFKDLNKDIDKSRSFVCRFEPSSAVLDNSPITTRYFRVRARYNYLLENSVTVNVESVPVTALRAPDYEPSIDFDSGPFKDYLLPQQPYLGFPSKTDLDTYFSNKNSPLAGIGQCIKDTEAETKVPALVILSIANLESDKSGGNWNKLSGLATLNYALFGIKCTDNYINNDCKFAIKKQCCRGYSKSTLDIIYEPTAVNVYRAYPSYCESVKDFANLISRSGRYRIALDFANDPEKMIRTIGGAGYATDPNWANKVIARMQIIKKDIEKLTTTIALSDEQQTITI